jgi:hypothetical protein
MTSLKERIMARAKPKLRGPGETVDIYDIGKGDEYYRLAPLLELFAECCEVLERECCCPGERNWDTGPPILCDPCEYLAKLEAHLGEE